MTDRTVRIHVTVRDRRNDSIVVDAEACFDTHHAFTDAMAFAHEAASDVPEADRHVSCHRV